MPTVDFAKLFDLFRQLDPDTVDLFMKFVQAAKNSSEGPNEFVKASIRKVLPVETVSVKRV